MEQPLRSATATKARITALMAPPPPPVNSSPGGPPARCRRSLPRRQRPVGAARGSGGLHLIRTCQPLEAYEKTPEPEVAGAKLAHSALILGVDGLRSLIPSENNVTISSSRYIITIFPQ